MRPLRAGIDEGGRRPGLVLAAALLLVSSAPASAQTAGGQPWGWEFELTPYLWASGMKGDVQAGPLPKVSVNMSFSDIFSILDFGAMGALEARNGRWGLLFDAIYMKVSDSATASRTGPGPIGATLTAHADLTMEQTMLAGAVAYRATEGHAPVDVIGGLRYSKIDVSATINASLFGQTGFAARSGNKDWVDPYVGVRIQHPLAERWTLVGYADVGGFGVGSDFTWQAMVGVNYAFSKTVTGKVGYRYIRVDYDKDGFKYDMATQGIIIGAGFRF